jgi:hypothetical protein
MKRIQLYDYFYFAIAISLVLFIFLESYFLNYYISPDSSHYLRAAQVILNGDGFGYLGLPELSENHFALWPIGYPLLIAFVAYGFGLEIYLASKLVSVIILILLIITLRKIFKQYIIFLIPIVLNNGFLIIFLYSWSEQMFILISLWITLIIVKILKSKELFLFDFASLIILTSFLFLSRYIGVYIYFVIVLGFIYLLFGIREKRPLNFSKLILMFFSALVSGVFILLYLQNNILNSEYATGYIRLPAYENPLQLLIMIVRSFSTEVLNLFIVFDFISGFRVLFAIIFALTIYLISSRRKLNIINKSYLTIKSHLTAFMFNEKNLKSIFLLLSGLFYYASITMLRLLSHFDQLNPRLLFPGTLLIYLGIFEYIINEKASKLKYFKNRQVMKYASLAIFAFLNILPISRLIFNLSYTSDNYRNYPSERRRIEEKFIDFKSGDIIITSERNLFFIRTDLYSTNARGITLDDFISKFSNLQSGNIYLDINRLPEIREGIYIHLNHDESFKNIFNRANSLDIDFVNIFDIIDNVD